MERERVTGMENGTGAETKTGMVEERGKEDGEKKQMTIATIITPTDTDTDTNTDTVPSASGQETRKERETARRKRPPPSRTARAASPAQTRPSLRRSLRITWTCIRG